MDRSTVDQVLEFLEGSDVRLLDLTGGAPEMNVHFPYLVKAATEMGVHVMDRSNLTILLEPGYEWLADFLASHQATIVASLPCYSEQNVLEQRGKGVFEKSIKALRLLNHLGYGKGRLVLNLVYNPNGAFLPPSQQQLELDYKRELAEKYGIAFDRLFTLANMPISRFGAVLIAKGRYNDYMTLLRENFDEQNLETLMCKNTLSVDWRGFLYDCDFNQMLDIPMAPRGGRLHISEIKGGDLRDNPIATGEHCYGCTAGQGSSCGGALNP
jgi:radical SAM/Cys-rich protein